MYVPIQPAAGGNDLGGATFSAAYLYHLYPLKPDVDGSSIGSTVNGGFAGGLPFQEENVSTFLAAGNKNHRERIRQYADQGFRYAGYIPTSYSTGGLPKAFDLIFEKEEQD